jgi:diguanylate cyclase (GGDEF)-like protein
MLLKGVRHFAACAVWLAAGVADCGGDTRVIALQLNHAVHELFANFSLLAISLTRPIALFGWGAIVWLLLIALVAAVLSCAAVWVRLRAKTYELAGLLEAQRKIEQLDIARNQVLETIAHNSPLPESMERLALAVEQQFPGSLCAVVMPADGGPVFASANSPVLVAPGVPEELQSTFAAAIAASVVCGCSDPVEKTAAQIANSLLSILRNAGLSFQEAYTTALFSTSAGMAGLLFLFVGEISPAEAERAKSNILPSASRLASLARDQSSMHQRLIHEARHDSLTGLPNRVVAEDRLEQALARAQRNSKGFAVFCIDLDDFKAINDVRGHEVGDGVLRAVASRLRASIRYSDTLARMGGDEFWAILEDCCDVAAAERAAQALVTALEDPVCVDSQQLNVSASVGIAMYPADGANATQLRRHADQAMYRAKSLGGHRISLWSGEDLEAGSASVLSPHDEQANAQLRASVKAP